MDININATGPMIERTGTEFIIIVVKVRNTKGNGKTGIRYFFMLHL